MRFIIFLLILTGFAAIVNFIPGCGTGPNAEEIEAKANAAFAAQGLTGLTAEMTGNVLNIRGEAENLESQQVARTAADAVRCEDCEKKWHVVRDETTVAEVVLPTANPYTFSAIKSDDGRVVLNGYVPSEADRERVLREADARFGAGNVVDRTVQIALGQPNAAWGEAISLNLNELSRLERGRLNMEGTTVLLSGRAASEAIREEINELAKAEPAGYNQALNIEVLGADADNVGTVDSEAVCQELLNDLNQENAILFAVNKATLQPGRPFEVLNTLAGGMSQCEGFKVRVEGHTSTPGDDAYNLQLSKARAGTVVAYLTSEKGVDASRLSSEGYGETRLKASPETTEADRAANRRIEFIVSR